MRNIVIFCSLLWMFGCKKNTTEDTRSSSVAIQKQFYGPETQVEVTCVSDDKRKDLCSTSDRRNFVCVSRDADGCGLKDPECIEEF